MTGVQSQGAAHPEAERVRSRLNDDMINFLDNGPPTPPPSAATVTTHASGRIHQSRPPFLQRYNERYTPARPDPWWQMKLGVGILLALSVWSAYVVIGRVCTPMIRGQSTADMGRATGIGTLIGFIILFCLYMWSYLMMITVGPGFAKERVPHVAQPHSADPTAFILYTSPPPHPENLPLSPTSASQIPHNCPTDHITQPTHEQMVSDPSGPDPSTLAPVANLMSVALHQATSGQDSATTLTGRPSEDVGLMRAAGKKDHVAKNNAVTDWREVQRPVPRVDLGPRWCRFCQINKPDRTHHCRHCGTCVMQFDHHCLWIGQCVGWANHKFFIIFTFWGLMYCMYMLIFLVITASRDTSTDGQVIGLIAVSALFGIFTLAMFPSHVHLILTGRTTVESYRGRDQVEQEDRILQMEYGYLWHNQDKRKVRKKWKEEWGGTSVDERWKWGQANELWRQEMGDSWIGWIFPIGRPKGDGIKYRSNPRFGPNGEWLQKKDWPEMLRA